MPKEFTATNTERISFTEAWDTIADFLAIDLETIDIATALEQMHQIRQASRPHTPTSRFRFNANLLHCTKNLTTKISGGGVTSVYILIYSTIVQKN